MPPEMVQGCLEYNPGKSQSIWKINSKNPEETQQEIWKHIKSIFNNVTDLDQELVSPGVFLTLLAVFPEGRG